MRLEQSGADSVTRRTILGTSGRLGFLGAATATWLLVDTATGTVMGSDSPAARVANRMIYDLGTGQAGIARVEAEQRGARLPRDLQPVLEGLAVGAVAGLSLVLIVVTVIGLLRFALGQHPLTTRSRPGRPRRT